MGAEPGPAATVRTLLLALALVAAGVAGTVAWRRLQDWRGLRTTTARLTELAAQWRFTPSRLLVAPDRSMAFAAGVETGRLLLFTRTGAGLQVRGVPASIQS